VILENDVNAGVYGEFINGAAKGYEHVLGVFPELASVAA
jgi:predicted NBD/HSP70 family sugar kinase